VTGIRSRYLDDQELDRLVQAAIIEARRRGRPIQELERPSADRPSARRKVEASAASLTRGQLNAVRAAFKAGISPSRITRQFGLSQSDVRRALAAGEPGR
jgi:DNA invertase Pin-like site-specific DNA recombinase